MKLVATEEQIAMQISQYMRTKYPNVLFHWDFGSGTKLSMSQAVRQKRLNERAWPDFSIPMRRGHWSGFFMELKAAGVRINKKDGSWANEHVREQNETLLKLSRLGNYAVFAVGFDEAVTIIDGYLSVGEHQSNTTEPF